MIKEINICLIVLMFKWLTAHAFNVKEEILPLSVSNKYTDQTLNSVYCDNALSLSPRRTNPSWYQCWLSVPVSKSNIIMGKKDRKERR